MIGNSNDKTNFAHKLFLTDTQVWKISKVFANGSSANVKFSKTQLSKVVQLGEFLTGIVNAKIEIFKAINRLASLVKSMGKESARTLVNARLSLFGKKIQ